MYNKEVDHRMYQQGLVCPTRVSRLGCKGRLFSNSGTQGAERMLPTAGSYL